MLGYLDRFEYYINKPETDKSVYDDQTLRLEGSEDGLEYETLWTVDSGVTAGWNVHTFPETSKPSYNMYRFYGTTEGSCRLGEIKLVGIVYINDRSNYFECDPELHLDYISTALNYFTVDASVTPKITSMSKNYGSVAGGDVIEFIGTGFPEIDDDSETEPGVITVLIDGVACDVDSELQTETFFSCTTG